LFFLFSKNKSGVKAPHSKFVYYGGDTGSSSSYSESSSASP
jgi:hypothetical protein